MKRIIFLFYKLIQHTEIALNRPLLSDKAFLKLRYLLCMGEKLNLSEPKTFNEKLQWLKLYDRNPAYTMMVDKYKVREYIKETIGEEYLIPLLGVWDNPDDIDFDALPDKFVLKCNHNSGLGMCICKDKSTLDVAKVRTGLRKGLKENYYLSGREWPYKDVERKIVCEQYMEDSTTEELRDYKFFCFDGEVKALFVATDRQTKGEETKFDFFDADYNHLPFTNGHPNARVLPEKPKAFDKMKALAAILSKNIPQVRVDFYEVDGRIYFGELTFSHWSGMVPFDPPAWGNAFGEWIKLPDVKRY